MPSGKGWDGIQGLPPAATIRDIINATGHSRRTIRGLLKGIKSLPSFGRHGALSYDLDDIVAAVAAMPGKGNRRGGTPLAYSRADVISVECPTCHATPGQACQSPGATREDGTSHFSRDRAFCRTIRDHVKVVVNGELYVIKLPPGERGNQP